MAGTWTIKQLKEFSDARFVIAILNERKARLNPYEPLAARLQEVIVKIEAGKKLTERMY